MNLPQRFLATALSLSLLLFTIPQELSATPPNLQEEYADLSDGDLDALVASIALYPDALVAQVLGAATYPIKTSKPTISSRAMRILRRSSATRRRAAILGSRRSSSQAIPFRAR